MLEINLRRLCYSSLFPKSKMGGLTELFKVDTPSWSLLRPYAERLHGTSMNSFSLKKAVENLPLLTMLYMKEIGKWDTMSYLSGESPQAVVFKGLYAWLEDEPAVPTTTHECDAATLIHREVDMRDSYTFPKLTQVKGDVYWVSYATLYVYSATILGCVVAAFLVTLHWDYLRQWASLTNLSQPWALF
jgi:hypothetical protein